MGANCFCNLLGNCYGKFLETIGLKTPGNLFAAIWYNIFSICLWEKPKLVISMISGFWHVSRPPKTNHFHLWVFFLAPLAAESLLCGRRPILSPSDLQPNAKIGLYECHSTTCSKQSLRGCTHANWAGGRNKAPVKRKHRHETSSHHQSQRWTSGTQ